ncbi:hypothetical protein P8C59_006258 [Phyllachora maydis]|uniref:RNA polymerase II assembly factor Rtp1 C-terminal domain-containing protein n=1 Tax=Phyllachora maydis TaxID=1825666 RepID=A0AAD9MFB9_9PEZI|nr:hypothetical protein P8C59_006258 [Phyllachora maydis]
MGETFRGDVAQKVGEALLSVAGRRGRRPKTEARQAREDRLQQLKNQEAADAWGGAVPDMSDEDVPEEERIRNQFMSQIVSGWESKRGAEDVRIRASAVSIFAHAVETNPAGMGAKLVSTAVDLSVNILQLERGGETGILRRAAVLLTMSFLRALEKARERRQRLGFGMANPDDLTRILRYVADTDIDGLVKQHALDVLESLENWKAGALLPECAPPRAADGGLTRLVGLSVAPELPSSRGRVKPVIEEVD